MTLEIKPIWNAKRLLPACAGEATAVLSIDIQRNAPIPIHICMWSSIVEAVTVPPGAVLEYDRGDYPGVGYSQYEECHWSSRTLVFARPVNLGCAVAQWDGYAHVFADLVPLNELDKRLYPSSFLPMRKNITRRFAKGRKSNRWRNVRVGSTPLELATV